MPMSILQGPNVSLPNRRLTCLLDNDRPSNDTIAIIDDDLQMTYGQLHAQSNMIARELISCIHALDPVTIHGHGYHIVAIDMKPCAARIVAVLGVLKAGAAYLPLDGSFPLQRTKFMIENCGACAVLAEECNVISDLKNLLDNNHQVIDYNDLLSKALSTGTNDQILSEQEKLDTKRDGGSLAAIFYTSGTTGKPKAVPITHLNILNSATACEIRISAQNTIRQSSFFNFLSIAFPVELFNCLLHQKCTVIFPDEAKRDDSIFHNIVIDKKLSRILSISPTILQKILTSNKMTGFDTFQDVAYCGTGAEIVSPVIIQNFFDCTRGKCELINIWGMTETTMYSITKQFTCLNDLTKTIDNGHAPIGTPAANTNVYIVDENGTVVDEECEGQIAISGLSVTKGYVFADEVYSFIPNKIIENPADEHKTLFLTGDYGYMKNGMVYFRGREMMRIKIRGYSVNAIEIDEVILSFPGVIRAATFAHQIKDDDVTIVTYAVPDPTINISTKDIISHCKKSLPEYSIPRVIFIDKMPTRPPQMKTDYPALKKMFKDYLGDQSEDYDHVWSKDAIFHILANSLAVPKQEIQINQSFYDLGGNSANAVAVWGQLVELGYTGSLAQFLGAKTIGDILNLSYEQSTTSNYIIQPMSELTDDEQNNVCKFIAESYYNNRNELFRKLFPYSYDEYLGYVYTAWPAAKQEGISFVIRTRNSKQIAAAAFNISQNADTLLYEANKEAGRFYIGDILMEEVEGPFLKALPALKGKTLFASRFATDPNLPASEVMILSDMLMDKCIEIAKEKKFARIHSASLIPALQTRQIERGAKVWSKVHLKSFRYKDEKPFDIAPDDAYHMSLVLEL